jgi:hypothetical protein
VEEQVNNAKEVFGGAGPLCVFSSKKITGGSDLLPPAVSIHLFAARFREMEQISLCC